MMPHIMQVKDNEVFMSNYDTFEGLLEIMDRLREPGGATVPNARSSAPSPALGDALRE